MKLSTRLPFFSIIASLGLAWLSSLARAATIANYDFEQYSAGEYGCCG